MVIDTEKAKKQYSRPTLFLGFRDTVMLGLGFFPSTMTRQKFYDTYVKLHQQLTRIGAIMFDLPNESTFGLMLQKLFNQGLLQEKYQKENYGIDLNDAGQAAFEVILSNLQIHPMFQRIVNVFEFYRSAAF